MNKKNDNTTDFDIVDIIGENVEKAEENRVNSNKNKTEGKTAKKRTAKPKSEVDPSKPKRGRPKKETPPPTHNEDTRNITMSQKQLDNIKKQAMNEGKKEFSETMENIALAQVQNRWRSIFSSYGTLGIETIREAWSQGWGSLNNPWLQNYRIKQINAKAHKMDQDGLQNAMMSPEDNEIQLSEMSWYLYYTNYVYHTLINLHRETPMYNWYATPQYIDAENMSGEDFKKESQFVDRIMKKFNPKLSLKNITTQVYVEGKSSYLPRISYNEKTKEPDFFVLQKLNTDMVKLTGFGSKQQFIASFNMIIFLNPAYDVTQYPKYIRDTWYYMLNTGIVVENDKGDLELNPTADLPRGHVIEWTGKYYMYWVQLPQDLCYTFYSDGGHPMAFPDTIGLFDDLNDLEDYRWLQANLLSKGVTSVLTAQVPMVKDPKPGGDATAISPDTVLGYTDLFSQTVSANILPFFAPFSNYELHTIENQPESLDIIYDRTRDLIATSGLSALLTISDKPSIASVKAAQSIQASKMEYLTQQYEQFLNNIINSEFGLKNKWKITLWGDIFYIRDDLKNLKELVLSGMEGLMPKLLSAVGTTLEDYRCSKFYMDALEVKIEKSFDIEKMEKQAELNLKTNEELAKVNADMSIKISKENSKLNNNTSTNTSTKSNKTSTKSTKTTTKVSTGTKADDKKSDSEAGLSNGVGRPSLSDSDVENDATATSKDAGNNTSDIKEFSVGIDGSSQYQTMQTYIQIPDDSDIEEFLRTPQCAMCGKDLESDEEYICDECLESYFAERLGDL